MKDYKRVTKRTDERHIAYSEEPLLDVFSRLAELEDKIEDGTLVEWKYKKEALEEINKLNTQLFEISQKIEQGRLVELPCKVGDTVYWIQREDKGIEELEVKSIGVNINPERKLTYLHCEFFTPTYEHLIGYRLFLTKEEAEARLQELRGGK